MRQDIEKYLGTVMQSTAKTIADRIGIDRFDAARELNHMLADGVVEREKRQGGGNEYTYWLARAPSAQLAAVPTTEVREAAVVAPVVADEVKPVVEAPQLSELLELLGVRKDSQFKLIDAIEGAQSLISARALAAAERDSALAEAESQKDAIGKLRENNAALEKRIDELTLGPVGAKAPLFVTVGRYATPKRHASLDKAQKRAASLVRNEKESEVLVLEPVGRVVRGSEWRPR